MNFKLWLENTEFQVPISKLYGWIPKIQRSIEDIKANRLSMSGNNPLTLSKLDAPKGAFFIIDGYHRVIENIMQGNKTMKATIDVHVPRIERTGGAFINMVTEKARIIDLVHPNRIN